MNPNRATARFLSKPNSNLTQSQAAASAALPTVYAPSKAEVRQVSVDSVGYFVINLGIGEAADVRTPGHSIFVHRLLLSGLSVNSVSPLPNLTLSTDQKGVINVFQAPSRFDRIEPFTTVRITNTSGQPAFVTGWIGAIENISVPPTFDDITLVAGRPLSGVVGSSLLTRPNNATPYAAGQVVNTAAGGINMLSGFGLTRLNSGVFPINARALILRVRMTKSGINVTNASFRLFLFNEIGPLTAVPVDQAAMNLAFTDSTFVTAIDIPAMVVAGPACAFGEAQNLNIPIDVVGVSLKKLVIVPVALAAYVPDALEQFKVDFWTEQA